jgi:hypothetical protein
MRNSGIKVWLSPINGGSCTRLRLSGVLPTTLPVGELGQLMEKMLLTHYPIECVLSVDEEAVDWREWWLDHLAAIPAHHLKMSFALRNRKRRGAQ